MAKKIIWSPEALFELKEIYEYFERVVKLTRVADHVIEAIIESTSYLERDFEIFLPNRFKLENDGSYRAYELLKYRVTYKILPHEIHILSIIHSSRMPKYY